MSHAFREGAEAPILSTQRPAGTRRLRWRVLNLVGSLLTLAFLVALGAALFLGSGEDVEGAIFLGLFGCVTLAPLLIMGTFALGRDDLTRRSEAAAREVALYPARLWWRDARGERSVDLSEVARFWRDESILPDECRERVSVVTLRSGEKLEFTSRLPDYDALCVRLSCALAPRFFPEYFARLERGERVELGELSLDREHLYWPGARLPWAELLGYEFRANPQTFGGMLVLRFGNGEGAPREYSLDSSDNPELGLLLALVEQCAPRRVRVDVGHAASAQTETADARRDAGARARG